MSLWRHANTVALLTDIDPLVVGSVPVHKRSDCTSPYYGSNLRYSWVSESRERLAGIINSVDTLYISNYNSIACSGVSLPVNPIREVRSGWLDRERPRPIEDLDRRIRGRYKEPSGVSVRGRLVDTVHARCGCPLLARDRAGRRCG